MRKLIFAISALALVTSAAFADPIADRTGLDEGERQGNGRAGATWPRGRSHSTPLSCSTALKTLNDDAQKMDVAVLFPAGSDTGGDTTASPKIWEDMAGFQAKVDKFKADAAAAARGAAPGCRGSRRRSSERSARTAAVATRRSASRRADRWASGES